ncbi:uncharacterized protein B0I36DRAFT_363505 [Microdochium trichocladiopsis]|uniref:Uncharacterized protein n=1 Tax=Microdochium trichocladiopsis TaxID=1682393 RepID=A0A9P8Y3U5_9PEZI|nr:uncharacterized protein B0I36DRAFT_363505 [Microdochium trichocladiopsis]KAH7028894.1 hypothetical protein B0I36DRAFT_363505 [Microdochium trichocladiopsis]
MLKAKTRHAQLLRDYDVDTFVQRPLATEETCPAWAQDIRLLALELVHNWEGVSLNKIPQLAPVMPRRLEEAFRHNFISGCTTGDDGYWLTDKGRSMRSLMRNMGGMSWASAWLATSAARHDDPVCQNVLVFMAALIESGAESNLCSPLPSPPMTASPPSSQAREYTCCARICRDRAHHGTLWFTLGVLLGVLETGNFAPNRTHQDWLEIKCGYAQVVSDKADAIFQELGMARHDIDRLVNMPLTQPQLTMIDKELAWSHLHQLVFAKADIRYAEIASIDMTDCCSLASVLYAGDPSQLSINEWLENNNFRSCYFAYRELRQAKLDGSPEQYFVTGLTVIPSSALLDIARQTKTQWPLTVIGAQTSETFFQLSPSQSNAVMAMTESSRTSSVRDPQSHANLVTPADELRAAFEAVGDIRAKFPGQSSLQSVLLTSTFPTSPLPQTDTQLDHQTSAEIDAAAVVLWHLYAHVHISKRGDPTVSTADATALMHAEDERNTLLRFIWADFEQDKQNLFHNVAAQHAIRTQIAGEFLTSGGSHEAITCANLLFSPLMLNTLWKRDGFRYGAADCRARETQETACRLANDCCVGIES